MAEASQVKQVLEKEIICPLCLDIYKEPKKLPCDHVYCKDCLKSLAEVTANATISCLECHSIALPLSTVESYDNELNEWLPCLSMDVSRSALGLVAYGGCLYTCGGFGGSFQSSVEKLVLGMELWEKCVPIIPAGESTPCNIMYIYSFLIIISYCFYVKIV